MKYCRLSANSTENYLNTIWCQTFRITVLLQYRMRYTPFEYSLLKSFKDTMPSLWATWDMSNVMARLPSSEWTQQDGQMRCCRRCSWQQLGVTDGNHSVTEYVTRLLDMKNENIDGFQSRVSIKQESQVNFNDRGPAERTSANTSSPHDHNQWCHYTTISLSRQQVWVIKRQVLIITWQQQGQWALLLTILVRKCIEWKLIVPQVHPPQCCGHQWNSGQSGIRRFILSYLRSIILNHVKGTMASLLFALDN